MNILRLKKAGLFIFLLAAAFIQVATAQDFTFSIQPSSLTLVPGQSSSFVVTVTPFDGFTNQVTLSISNLPSGVTATFSPQTITSPPGTSLLTLNATTNAATGSFTLGLVATGGGITNYATSSVSVSFGLLPLCYGAFQGTITDATTGLPVPYATVNAGNNYATANASGQYLITNLALSGSDNQPAYYGVTAEQTNYYESTDYAYAVCDATNTVNVSILLEEEGTISGILTSQEGQPLSGVLITATYQYTYYATTDTNGAFQFTSLGLAQDNGAADYEVRTSPAGYWTVYSNTIVQANSNSVVDLVAVPICTSTVTGSAVYTSTGLPATNASVLVETTGDFYGTTDVHGNYTVSNVTLNTDNTPISAYVQVTAPGSCSGYIEVEISNCDTEVTAPVIMITCPAPPPTNYYGSITGHVYDLQTGLVITNADVGTYYGSAETDSNGLYLINNVLVGTTPTSSTTWAVYASALDYFESESNVVVTAGMTSTQNFYLLRVGYGAVDGTVFNASTGLPVPGAYVYVAGIQYVTGPTGQYATGLLQLGAGNVPTSEYISAQDTGYWSTSTNTTITNGITNIVNIEMIPVCQGATIIGNVVNALTQEPITNATVTVSSQYYYSTMTDSNGDFILTNITVGNNNSPIQTTLEASAPGYNPQSKTLTIFCDATISTEFGAPETVFGAIDGYVTNAITGQPLTNVFIGSSFGEATDTDTNGYYILHQAPLGANGSNRTWTVTAGPVVIGSITYPAQNKSVVVSSNMTNQLNFGFGQPPTELVVSATGNPSPVYVGSNLVYTITLTNSAASASDVVLADTLPPNVTFLYASITNNSAGTFTEPTLSNGVVTTTTTNFSSDSAVVLLITVSPTAAGILTNVVTVTSETPDVNPSGTNHSATVINPAIAPLVPLYADLSLTMSGAPNPVLVSNQLTYALNVSNLGPTNAPGVVLTDSFPANVTFSSVTLSQGTYSSTPAGLQWTIGALNDEGTASATIVVQPLLTGELTNTATVSILPSVPSVTDTNLANNTASVVTAVTALTLTNLSDNYGPNIFNPQTGLFQQTNTVTNLSGVAASAVRVSVLDLPSGVQLYNASGSSDGVPYVEYDQPVPPGGNVVFLLEYYESTRQPFLPTNFVVTIVAAVVVPTPTGTMLQLDRNPFLSEGQLTIEFASVPGHTYVVEYSSDMQTWLAAAPPIVAKNTRTVWVDAGPPVTESLPGSPGQRFYRIVQTN
ncbi:MAG TPA: carboxypeptidase regulatory-like domain-containing protein [Candidatus Baltobacteraceae bacterium]|jgi:uncharacterized repeat protein (TIGR01451 family)|nr:carboxypeptidase regulatory-like domain-containing protein [Candidatus Baltobacteraceae bacterium]